MNWSQLSDNERLVAEHAVTAYQALKQAAAGAAQGQGMAMIEQALHEKGFETLRRMVELAASDHPEAQKKTRRAAGRVRAARR